METNPTSSAPSKSPGTRFLSVVVGLLLLGLVGAGWAAFRAESRSRAHAAAAAQTRRERDAAERARQSAEETIRRLQDERDAAKRARLSAEETARRLRAEYQRWAREADARRVQSPPPQKPAQAENPPPEPGQSFSVAPPIAILRLPDGATYEGETANGKRHGKGTCTWPNGQIYSGEWADDKRNGPGSYKWPNGLVQSGKWIENKFSKIP